MVSLVTSAQHCHMQQANMAKSQMQSCMHYMKLTSCCPFTA